MRIWFRQFLENRMVKDTTVDNYEADTRTHKVLASLEKACAEFDIAVPVWLETNITDFKRNAKCRFYKDSFIEDIPFDYLEMQVIEEDW